jgi:uncharacterized protein (DUF1501 family)
MFSLHPALKFTHSLCLNKQMSPIVAVGTNYRELSHFEAQDLMECGLDTIDYAHGWLSRALKLTSGKSLAISRTTPLSLKGANELPQTCYPSRLADVNDDTLERLLDLYAKDDLLQSTLSAAIAQKQAPAMEKERNPRPNFDYLAKRCGEIMASGPSISCAMLEMGGWDTHNNQQSRLNRLLWLN